MRSQQELELMIKQLENEYEELWPLKYDEEYSQKFFNNSQALHSLKWALGMVNNLVT